MLQPKKKISRRELKQDALITTYVKAVSFYENKKKLINYGIIAVLAVGLGTVFYINNQRANNEKATSDLGKIHEFYDRNQFQVAIDGIPERNIPGLKSIVENYGGTTAGNFARFYLANAYYQLGRYRDALEHFKEFSPEGQLLTVSRLSGIASCYEAMMEHENAAEYYEQAAVKYSKDIDAAANLHRAASNYGLAGKKAKAIDLFKRLKKDFPTTSYAREADRFIAQLSV